MLNLMLQEIKAMICQDQTYLSFMGSLLRVYAAVKVFDFQNAFPNHLIIP